MPTPFGIFEPSSVSKADVGDLKATLLLYGRTSQAKGGLTSAEAHKLRKSKNYYLWALGTWALARLAKRPEVRRWLALLGRYSVPGHPAGPVKLSPRRAFWLVHCIRRVVPATARPSATELSAALTGYLRRLATPPVPGYTY